jgi:hypothetical protein
MQFVSLSSVEAVAEPAPTCRAVCQERAGESEPLLRLYLGARAAHCASVVVVTWSWNLFVGWVERRFIEA